LKRSTGVTLNLHLAREAQSFDIVLGVAAEHDYSQIIAQAGDFLATQEAAYFGSLRFIRRQRSYLLGRYAAKIALRQALDVPELNELEIVPGVFGQPLVACSSKRGSGISRPQIMLYFGQAPACFSTIDALEQKRKVIAFREELRDKALVWDYTDADSFESVFRKHFQSWLTSEHSAKPAPPSNTSRVRDVKAPVVSQTTATESGFSWLLLKDRFLRCESLAERQDGSIIAKLPDVGSTNESLLRSFQTREHWRRETLPYAFGDDGGLVNVKSAERESQSGRSVWSLILQLDRSNRPHALSEPGFNGISADELAAMRARWLLLNESPQDNAQGVNGGILRTFVAGINLPIRVTEGIFPDLWRRFAEEREHFLSLARLWAVFNLKASNTVEHVLELELGPVRGNSMRVRFRGLRHQIYTNRAAGTIDLSGECQLE
jgi:hypothetical protein